VLQAKVNHALDGAGFDVCNAFASGVLRKRSLQHGRMLGEGTRKFRECDATTFRAERLPVALRVPQVGRRRRDLGARGDSQGVVDEARTRITDGKGTGMRR
jgi:hypothetical protein